MFESRDTLKVLDMKLVVFFKGFQGIVGLKEINFVL